MKWALSALNTAYLTIFLLLGHALYTAADGGALGLMFYSILFYSVVLHLFSALFSRGDTALAHTKKRLLWLINTLIFSGITIAFFAIIFAA